jgi:sensor histidine kinase YesM
MQKNGLEIFLNVLFWLASAWLIASSFSIQAQEIELVNEEEIVHTIRNESLLIKLLLLIFCSSLMFYVHYWNLKRLQSMRTHPSIWILALSLIPLTYLLYSLLEKIGLSQYQLSLPKSIIFGTLIFYFTLSSTYALAKVWWASIRKQQVLAYEKKQAELFLLRNQLQPHFLFNALNNLLSMVDQQQSPQLAQAFEQLSKLLRYVTEETQADQVAIQKEIDFIHSYAALQSLRFEENEIDFNLEIKGEYRSQHIEPGILIAFVENAFKYGAVPEQKNKILVQFDLSQPHEIGFSIENACLENLHITTSSGTGIQSTKDRLTLVYPQKHQLNIQQNGLFRVDLKLQTL